MMELRCSACDAVPADRDVLACEACGELLAFVVATDTIDGLAIDGTARL
ncbi:MAG TPA: hypothetical protein VE591_06805 [Candidatus Acidoferrum sp.]|nr:hypothetical protein [Candidatus Acidoferrum sp.]